MQAQRPLACLFVTMRIGEHLKSPNLGFGLRGHDDLVRLGWAEKNRRGNTNRHRKVIEAGIRAHPVGQLHVFPDQRREVAKRAYLASCGHLHRDQRVRAAIARIDEDAYRCVGMAASYFRQQLCQRRRVEVATGFVRDWNNANGSVVMV